MLDEFSEHQAMALVERSRAIANKKKEILLTVEALSSLENLNQDTLNFTVDTLLSFRGIAPESEDIQEKIKILHSVQQYEFDRLVAINDRLKNLRGLCGGT